MIRAVIFDCFGVIITDALQLVIEEVAVSNPETAQAIVDTIHANNRGFMMPAESNQKIAQLLGTTAAAFRKRIEQGETKDERVLKYIKDLHGKYKTALLSNIGRESLHRRFTDQELRAHFDAVIVSGDLGVMKPDPEIYLHAAEKLGVQPQECIFVDDRETHCNGARAVGMQAVHYETFTQASQAIEQLLADAKDEPFVGAQ